MSRGRRGAFWLLPALALNVPLGASFARAETPEDSLRTLRPRPGFKIELVAAEPLIREPGRLRLGTGRPALGRRDARLSPRHRQQGQARRPDRLPRGHRRRRPLRQVHGLPRWATLPDRRDDLAQGRAGDLRPDIFYAEDTDGDGRADRREVLFTGFGEANPQHRVNGLRWGLDNWVYCANGDFAPVRTLARVGPPDPSTSGFSASQAEDLRRLALAGAGVRSMKSGTRHDIRNRDFRVRPEEGLLDPQSGQSQFGRDRDDWGNWFGCNHATPFWHYALDDHYLRRNPHVASPGGRVEAPRSVDVRPGHGAETRGRRETSKGTLGPPVAASWSTATRSSARSSPETGSPASRCTTWSTASC